MISKCNFWLKNYLILNLKVLISSFLFDNLFNNYSSIQGRIDQVNQVLELKRGNQTEERYYALDKWCTQLSALQSSIANKMS